MKGQSELHDAVASGDQEKVVALLHDGADVEERNSDWTPLMFASANGYVDLARSLVDHGADLHALNDKGQSALHLAAMWGRADACRLLIRLGADVNAQDTLGGCTPLHAAAMRSNEKLILDSSNKERVVETCSVLLAAGADVNARVKAGITVLIIAALTWQHDLVELLLQHGADLEARDHSGKTVLSFVSRYCHIPNVPAQLLAHGADVNTQDDEGHTPLMIAALTAQQAIIGPLLDHGAEINCQDAQGRTALMYAACKGPKGNAIDLLEREADTMAEDENTPDLDPVKKAERLAKYYHVRAEVVRLLLERGADPELADGDGRTAWDIALEHGRRTGGNNAEVLCTIRPLRVRTETFGDVAYRAAQNGDAAEMTALLYQGVKPDAPDRHGFTALSRAAQFDRLDLIHILLAAGANPNAPNKWGATPLMAAKSAAIAEALLEADADINAVTQPNNSGIEPGQTALMKAAQHGNLAVAQVLLAHGADMEKQDARGRSALILAASNNHTQIAEALVRTGAFVGLVEAALLGDVSQAEALLRAGDSLRLDLMAKALWWAAGNGNSKVVLSLLRSGADVNARGYKQMTALSYAAFSGHVEIVELLLSCGADVNTYDERRTAALHWSLISSSCGCNAEIVEALLTAGADVNHRTRTGGTALIWAAMRGATDCARLLIDHGADVEAVSDFDEDGAGGWTALLAAVANSRQDTIRLLIESGADVNNSGKGSHKPLTVARSRSRRTETTNIVNLLVAAGAAD